MVHFRQVCGDCGGSRTSNKIIGRTSFGFAVYAICERCKGTGDNYPPLDYKAMNRPVSPPPPPRKRFKNK